MAEPYRTDDPNAPHNPPQSVVNPAVRRAALRAYLGPIALFFLVVAIALTYWWTRPPRPDADARSEMPRAEGTAGITGPRTTTPGGFEPQPRPDATRDEVAQRGSDPITELSAVYDDERHRGVLGRRVELHAVEIERVESPGLLWLHDGNVRVAVAAPPDAPSVKAGERVDVVGVVERVGENVRIKASRIDRPR